MLTESGSWCNRHYPWVLHCPDLNQCLFPEQQVFLLLVNYLIAMKSADLVRKRIHKPGLCPLQSRQPDLMLIPGTAHQFSSLVIIKIRHWPPLLLCFHRNLQMMKKVISLHHHEWTFSYLMFHSERDRKGQECHLWRFVTRYGNLVTSL